jgi:CRISPR system Cascade subunit CasB
MDERKNKYPFSKKKKAGEKQEADRSCEILQEWWEKLKEKKGDRAVLRRSACLTEVIFVRAFSSLLNNLRTEGYIIPEKSITKLAAIAGLASHVENDEPGTLGAKLGTPISGDKSPLSDLRMRNMLARDDFEELFTLMRRAVGIIGGNISLADLAFIIWNWQPIADKNPYDSRRKLALDYYAAAPI